MNYSFSDKLANLRPSAIREIFKSLTDPSIISFAAGNPSPESFPVEALAALAADIFRTQSTAALQYNITEGYPPLREAVAARQKAKFGIGRDFDTTIIVSGGQQGIELACKAFCNEGDVVLCEEPSFVGALNAFRSNGAVPVGVKCDGEGIIPSELEDKLRRHSNAKLLYIIPSFQNPSGITTPIDRRRAVYDLCRKYGVVILEDNPYGELRFAGEDGVAAYGVIMYASFLFVAVFVGYAVGSAPIVSYHYGANNRKEVNNLYRKSLKLIGVVAVGMTIGSMFIIPHVARFFVGYDENLLILTTRAFRLYGLSFLIMGFNVYASSFFTALGDGVTSALISFLRTLAFQVIAILLLPLLLGIDGIWLAVTAAELAALAVSAAMLLTKDKVFHYRKA